MGEDAGEVHAPLRIPDTHLDLLERPLIANLATVRPDGGPQVNPMWFVWEAASGIVRLTHTSRRHNYRCIVRDPRVALSIVDPSDVYRYMQLKGVVQRIEDDRSGRFYDVLSRRYFGRVTDVPDREHRVILSVRPTDCKVR